MFESLSRWYHDWSNREARALDQVFSGRSLLTDDEFYTRYFPQAEVSCEVVAGVRALFIKHIPLDMRRLAPDDDLGRELQFVWSHDSMADVELILALEKHFEIAISEAEAKDARTMGDVIRLVEAKLGSPRD